MARRKAVDYRKATELLRLAGNPARLHVLLILADGEHLFEAIHDLVRRHTPAKLEYHLALLHHGGLIARRRRGMDISYALTDRGRRLVEVVRALMG